MWPQRPVYRGDGSGFGGGGVILSVETDEQSYWGNADLACKHSVLQGRQKQADPRNWLIFYGILRTISILGLSAAKVIGLEFLK